MLTRNPQRMLGRSGAVIAVNQGMLIVSGRQRTSVPTATGVPCSVANTDLRKMGSNGQTCCQSRLMRKPSTALSVRALTIESNRNVLWQRSAAVERG